MIPFRICIAYVLGLVSFHLPAKSYAQKSDTPNTRRYKVTLVKPKYEAPSITTKKVSDSGAFNIWIRNDGLHVEHKKVYLPISTTEDLNKYIKSNFDLVQKDGINIKFYTDTQEGKFEEIIHVLKENNIDHFSMSAVY